MDAIVGNLSVRFSSRHSLLPLTVKDDKVLRNVFQSAFHRGIHCYSCGDLPSVPARFLSVRFSSRHSLLRRQQSPMNQHGFTFSPLFIAAFTATFFRKKSEKRGVHFQSAFHRGIHCYVCRPSCAKRPSFFQSAFHRGIHCYESVRLQAQASVTSFSPLFIAAFTATPKRLFQRGLACDFQSAFHRGIHCYS